MRTSYELSIRDLFTRRAPVRIDAPDGIDFAGFVSLGGIEQWISVRGDDVRNPVLVIVHGGPGAVTSIFTPRLRAWEQRFTVVQWDQRGAGKTFGRHGAQGELSLARLAEDGIDLALHLRARLGHEKVIVLGSSAGSAIALQMVRRRPELFLAYVGVDQNVGDPDGLGQRLAIDALRASGNVRGVRELERIGADPSRWSRDDFDRRNRIVAGARTGGPDMITQVTLPAMLSSPQHGWGDLLDVTRGLRFSLDRLHAEVATFDARAGGTRFELPVIVLQGAHDIVTPHALAERFVAEIDAPYKAFATIEGAGHLAAFAFPERFLDQLTRAWRGSDAR
ncbi:alpha/beta fold hydrolase [Sandaracinus amylolyticus]|uniref:alpha/beta fold hydrolase n=1 Tax=Sandaracinus amylolyticus TaxID=927083 RepID=UPI001F1B5BE1|nr:alpha/beta hydrolase [Sandaracinus amylolyticus]UJR84990.1 Hypothetical protein I5071_70690 [Sandaracinus amylolyticus]